MNRRRNAIVLIVVQCLLVLTIAGKFLYERKVCPRVWARAVNFDPNSPMRGRYLVLSPEVDACSLPPEGSRFFPPVPADSLPAPMESYRSARLIAREGKLVAVSAPDWAPSSIRVNIYQAKGDTCAHAMTGRGLDYYIPDTAKVPFPPKPGEVLWVEATVPPAGPPRPIQLALSRGGIFTPLKLN